MTRQNEDETAVRKLATEWSDGWISGDTEAILSLYTGDPILMPQDQPAVIGKNAIRELYEVVLKDFTVEGDGKVMEIGVYEHHCAVC
jgi:uncharacterized protein (TIGR02246 family)